MLDYLIKNNSSNNDGNLKFWKNVVTFRLPHKIWRWGVENHYNYHRLTIWIFSLLVWQFHNNSWKFNNFKFLKGINLKIIILFFGVEADLWQPY